MVIYKESKTINYFLPGPEQDNNKRVSAEITHQLQRYFREVFNGIGCFDGMFLLQLKPGSKPHEVPLRCVAYALQKAFQRGVRMKGTTEMQTNKSKTKQR